VWWLVAGVVFVEGWMGTRYQPPTPDGRVVVPCREGISNIRNPIEGLERANEVVVGPTGVPQGGKEYDSRQGPDGKRG
jgi:hypothetical protein